MKIQKFLNIWKTFQKSLTFENVLLPFLSLLLGGLASLVFVVFERLRSPRENTFVGKVNMETIKEEMVKTLESLNCVEDAVMLVRLDRILRDMKVSRVRYP